MKKGGPLKGMRTRPATAADFPAIADIALAAFWDDELYAFTNPHHVQYPHHFRDSFLRRFQSRYWTPGHVFFVAETEDADIEQEAVQGSSKQVIGFALWLLEHGTGSKSALKNSPGNSWLGVLERGLCRLRDAYVDFLGMDKSLERANLAIWEGRQASGGLDTFVATHARTEPAVGYYKLRNLCVHPSWQRKGVGGLLIRWGLDRAGEEGVPVVLSSSEMGAGLYSREGFRRVGEVRVDGWVTGGERSVGDGGAKDGTGEEEAVGGVDVGVLTKGKETEEMAVDERFAVPVFLWEANYREDNDDNDKRR